MPNNNLFLKSLIYVIQGAIVGVGAILPGISGGVLCVAFGIYEPMMALLTHPFKTLKQQFKMFIPLIIGWILGFVFLAKGVGFIFNICPNIALMLFFGLICGTIPELFKVSEKSDSTKSWTPFVLSLSFAYLLFHILENGLSASMEPSFFNYILSGLIWGLSLIIPGLSSSSLLIIFGIYEPLTAGIGALDFAVIIPFLIGIAGTALLFARLVTMLFQKHYAVISRIILGFVIASSLKIIPDNFVSSIEIIISLVCFAAGFIVSRLMDKARTKENCSKEN